MCTNAEQSKREKSDLVQTSVRRTPLRDNCGSNVADTRGSAPVHQLLARSSYQPIWQRSGGGGDIPRGGKMEKNKTNVAPPPPRPEQ